MTIEGAVIIEQGVTFALIHVDPSVTTYTVKSTQTRYGTVSTGFGSGGCR